MKLSLKKNGINTSTEIQYCFVVSSLVLESKETDTTGGLLKTFMTIKKPTAVNIQTKLSNEENVEGNFIYKSKITILHNDFFCGVIVNIII